MNTTQNKKIHINKTRKMRPKNIIVGKIYANWCGYCNLLKPEWKKMKKNMKLKIKSLPNIHFSFIEIEQTGQDEKIDKINRMYLENSDDKVSLQDGYPTLFRIEDGKLEYYSGKRIASDMEKFYLNGGTNIYEGGKKSRKRKSKGFLSFFGL
jgi:thiol-disulfide isomerase/thioredoxin